MDPLSSRRLGPVWRPRVAGEFSSIVIIGMFFGEFTVDVEHQLFCGVDSVHVGPCEVQAVFAALSWCHVANLEAKNVKIRPDSKYAIGVLDRSHRCIFTRAAGALHETVLGEGKKQILCQL